MENWRGPDSSSLCSMFEKYIERKDKGKTKRKEDRGAERRKGVEIRNIDCPS